MKTLFRGGTVVTGHGVRRADVLVDGETGREDYNLSARTNGGRLVHLKGDAGLVGQFVTVEITGGNTWALYGKEADGNG